MKTGSGQDSAPGLELPTPPRKEEKTTQRAFNEALTGVGWCVCAGFGNIRDGRQPWEGGGWGWAFIVNGVVREWSCFL